MLAARPMETVGPAPHGAKTPARALLKSRSGMQENAIRYPMTGGKDKSKYTAQTPYRLKNDQNPMGQGLLKSILATQSRPLLDKTPFPNRTTRNTSNTPFTKPANFTKPTTLDQNFLQPGKTPLRPSSTRKHARAPRSASKNFETPQTNGNHWDVADVSICQPEVDVEGAVDEPDHDEIEYMPPKPLEQPYVPPFDFDLPNYKELGIALTKAIRTYPVDDTPLPELQPVVHPVDDITLSLAEIADDDPFALLNLKQTTPKPAAISSRVAPRTRTMSSATTIRSAPSAKANLSMNPVPVRRPPTSRATSNMTVAVGANSKLPPRNKLVSIRPASTRPITASTAAVARNQVSIPPIRRPATSASTYKSSLAPKTVRPITTRTFGARTTTKKDDCEPLKFDLVVDDDFRFDV
ncbi:hypothetical protein PLEOSDRAFT_158698 [Pleurotus ostreatus PC15]|uniref:Uncharacterized protein n=1 Tax=Pleurotus ostreatus (strain PC15) TaxID=1137138 RepID=A0A067NTI3_PLEO1|nr:hypothetical protein PLEOSDRAFT_158698 [Pleurotus ostreatus PC15]